MTEFGYLDNTLTGERFDVIEKLDIYNILKDFVDYNLITEWQAGYVTALFETRSATDYYKKLLLFIHSQIDKED